MNKEKSGRESLQKKVAVVEARGQKGTYDSFAALSGQIFPNPMNIVSQSNSNKMLQFQRFELTQ